MYDMLAGNYIYAHIYSFSLDLHLRRDAMHVRVTQWAIVN